MPIEGPLPGFLQGMQDIEAVRQAPQRTRLLTAQAGQAEMKYRREKMMMDAMQQYGIRGDTPAEKMRFMGGLALDSGDPEAARKMFDSASLIDSRQANAQTSQARRQLIGSTLEMRNLDLQGRLLGQATDQKTWDAGNAYYFMLTGQMSPYAGQPFSKEGVARVQRDSMSTKDRISKELEARRTAATEEMRDTQKRNVDSEIKYREKILELRRKELERKTKAGAGTGVKDPGIGLQTQAARKISEAYPDLKMDAEMLNNSAYVIASEAQALRANNRGLTTEEALGRAFKTAVDQGYFKQSPKPSIMGFEYGSPKTKFTGGGRSAQTAIPLPTEGPSRYDTGTWYITPKGVGRYIGMTGDGKPEFESNEAESDDSDLAEDEDLK